MRKAIQVIGAILSVFCLAQFSTPAMAQTYVRRASYHITTATTTTVVSSTAWISNLAVGATTMTAATLIVQNKEGTPKVLYKTGSVGNSNPISSNQNAAILMTSGIDIVTTGTVVVDVFITYYI